jgi:hypothetical protein
MDKLFDEWNEILESEGLGVIDVGASKSTTLHRQLKKWPRLDAMINKPQPGSEMQIKPFTADSDESRQTFSWQVNGICEIDGTGDDTMLDCMAIACLATAKEAELADRRRASLFGLDAKGRPRSGKPRRQRDETDEQFKSRVAEALGIATDEMGPLYSPWSPPKPDHAHSYAGGGPLAMVDRPKPDYGNRRDDDVRMSPVVDTDGYLPGRGPYQLQVAQRGRGNSDITG